MTLSPNQAWAVAQLAGRCHGYRTVIIGASALGFYCDMTWRKTADVDLVIAIEMEDFPFGIDALEGWHRGNKEHEFWSAEGVKVDIIPAGPTSLDRGHVVWPSGHSMNLLGIDLALEHAETHEAHGVELAVASPCVIAVLKIAAYLDRPADRLRDLADLAHLIDIYEQDSDRYWDEALDQGVYALKAPYLLGIDIGTIAHDDHRALIDTFLDRVSDEDGVDHAQMTSRGPQHWTTEERPLAIRLDALREGLKTGM